MTKDRFYKTALVALFLLNVALICFLIFSKPAHHHDAKKHHAEHPLPPHPPKLNGPKAEIIALLEFDENQIKEYEVLIKKHQMDIHDVEKKIKSAKEKLYLTLDTNDTLVETNTILSISEYQAQLENIHLNHFKNIKEICTDEQSENFTKLTKKLAEFFAMDKKPV